MIRGSRNFVLWPGLLLCFCLSQCAKPSQHAPAVQPPAPVSATKSEPSASPAPSASVTPPSESPPQQKWDIARSSLAFTAAMYQQLAESESGNFAFSPASIQMALALAYAGARGETAAEMRRALQLQGEDDAMHRAFSEQMARWNADDTGLELSVANRMFLDDAFTPLESFSQLASEHYEAGVERVPFQSKPERARTVVNQWVLKATRSKIRELLPKGSLGDGTKLILANAVYLKGTWEHPFRPRATRPQTFFPASGAPVQVPMMYQRRAFGYAVLPQQGVKLLEMPYEGEDLSMLVILPDAGKMHSTTERLSGEVLQAWTGAMSGEGEVEVGIPLWRIAPSGSTRLKGPLRALGMRSAFDPGRSDFSGVDGTRYLVISDVYHRALVEVDEKGTEAAAATGVVAVAGAETTGRTFIANRPFLFLIRDRKTGVILFMGRVSDPRST